VSERASFERRIDAIADIFAFTAAAFARLGAPDALRTEVDFVLEELFTNIVPIPDGVEVTVTEPEADRFDVTRAPQVDVTLPADQRQPGGLGLHLVGRLVDSVQYGYSQGERCSRIVFRKTSNAPLPGRDNGDGRC